MATITVPLQTEGLLFNPLHTSFPAILHFKKQMQLISVFSFRTPEEEHSQSTLI